MRERQKETAFLRGLIRLEDTEAGRRLQERITKAECDEKCIRRALFVVALVGLLSLSGLCYSAVFLQDFFQNSSHLVIKFFSASGLGSLLCFGGFLFYWIRYRRASNHLHGECRRFVMGFLELHFHAPAVRLRVVQNPDLRVSRIATEELECSPTLVSLPKAS